MTQLTIPVTTDTTGQWLLEILRYSPEELSLKHLQVIMRIIEIMAKQKKTKSTRHHHIPRKAGSGRPGCDWNLEIRLVNDPQMEKRLRELMRILGIR